MKFFRRKNEKFKKYAAEQVRARHEWEKAEQISSLQKLSCQLIFAL
jgi:hypothetical protein